MSRGSRWRGARRGQERRNGEDEWRVAKDNTQCVIWASELDGKLKRVDKDELNNFAWVEWNEKGENVWQNEREG